MVVDVNQGHLSVDTGARILSMTKQGFWKFRRKINEFGLRSVIGRNYWISHGGSSEIFAKDNLPKNAAKVLREYFLLSDPD